MNTNLRAAIFLLVCLGVGNVYTTAVNYEELLHELEWKVGKECYKDVSASERNVKDFIIEATLAWNAKTPGLINGSHDYLGDYEGCLATPQDANKRLPQYCMYDVDLTYVNGPGVQACTHGTSRLASVPCSNRLKWALCAPSSCSKSEMLALAELLVKKSEIGQTGLPFNVSLSDYACQTAVKAPYSYLAIAFFSLLGIIAVIVTFCTVYHSSLRSKQPNTTEVQVPPHVLNWSLLHNWSGLLASPMGEVRAFHSLRFISTCTVIRIHRVCIYQMGPLINFEVTAMLIELGNLLRFEFSVDTFFTISGFIMMQNYLQSTKRTPVEMIVTRYFRLIPVYALMMFYVSSVLEYTASGPFWPDIVHHERDSCRSTWWLSLLMLTNYGQLRTMCWLPAWYIASDYHFFIMGVIVCCLMKRNKALGLKVIKLLIVASVVIFSTIILYTHMPVVIPRFTGVCRWLRFDGYLNRVYIKSHMRFGSYFIGMLAAYYAAEYAKPGSNVTQKTVEKWYKISYVLMVSTLFSRLLFNWAKNELIQSLYGALVRQIWSVGICLFVLAAMFGKIPRVSNLLDREIWVPLSKITYGMYCIHMAKQFSNIGSLLHPLRMDTYGYFTVVVSFYADIIFSMVGGLVLYLCVEAPCYNLIKMLFRNARMRKEKST